MESLAGSEPEHAAFLHCPAPEQGARGGVGKNQAAEAAAAPCQAVMCQVQLQHVKPSKELPARTHAGLQLHSRAFERRVLATSGTGSKGPIANGYKIFRDFFYWVPPAHRERGAGSTVNAAVCAQTPLGTESELRAPWADLCLELASSHSTAGHKTALFPVLVAQGLQVQGLCPSGAGPQVPPAQNGRSQLSPVTHL